MPHDGPLDGPPDHAPAHAPAHAWDWVARQRSVWREARRRLVAQGYVAAPAGRTGPSRAEPARPIGDVPDWSRDHPDLLRADPTTSSDALPDRTAPSRRDYGVLDTRAECIAALRADYPHDPVLRATVDAVVGELAFLGRLDVPLHTLGVRSAPRGMRWWWTRLTGRDADEGRSGRSDGDELRPPVPLQLRLVDVLAGYGDVADA